MASVFVTAVLLVSLGMASMAMPQYERFTLPGLSNGDWDTTTAWGINNKGEAVGESTGPDGYQHAVYWDLNGEVRDLDYHPPVYMWPFSAAYEINDNGMIVGNSSDGGRLWLSPDPESLRQLPGPNTPLYDINNKGYSVGDATINYAGDDNTPIMWDKPTKGATGVYDLHRYYTLDLKLNFLYGSAQAINNSGDIVGFGWNIWTETPNDPMPVYWRDQRLNCLLVPKGYPYGEALDIANNGTSVGYIYNQLRIATPCVWQKANKIAEILPLLPGATAGHATGVNDCGQIIGDMKFHDSDGWDRYYPVIWEKGYPYKLDACVINPGSCISYSARDINNAGDIVGGMIQYRPAGIYSLGYVLQRE